MIRRFKNLKIRTQSAIVLLCALLIAFTLFELLWLNKWNICETAEDLNLFYTQINDKSFRKMLKKEALNYNLPESEEDAEAVEAIKPFFDLVNEYTGIYIYDRRRGIGTELPFGICKWDGRYHDLQLRTDSIHIPVSFCLSRPDACIIPCDCSSLSESKDTADIDTEGRDTNHVHRRFDS